MLKVQYQSLAPGGIPANGIPPRTRYSFNLTFHRSTTIAIVRTALALRNAFACSTMIARTR